MAFAVNTMNESLVNNQHVDVASEVPRDKRRIQSIDVGFQVIRVLERANGKLPLKSIAEAASMPASKVYPYLVSFCDLGLVEQDPITNRYGLGRYAVQLGLSAIRQRDLAEQARVPMEALRESTGLSVHLSVWSDDGPVIVVRLDGDLSLPMSIRVGYVLPLLASATGRVYLAHLQPVQVAHLLKRELAYDAGLRARANDAAQEALASGIALSDSQLYEGFAGMSVPIFDHEEKIAAALTLLGERRHVELRPDSPAALALLAAGRALTLAMGGTLRN
jgi:DNA-binding IclR family transcriptional regulator